jgi:hypothetical protein
MLAIIVGLFGARISAGFETMSKTISKALLIFLASFAFLIVCCIFTTLIPSGSGSTPTAAPTITAIIYKEAIVVRDSSLPTPTYTFTPTAVNALTPSRTPIPIPTGTAVTPFLLPTKVPTSTFAYIYEDLPSYYYPDTSSGGSSGGSSSADTSDYGLASAICRDGTLSYSSHRRGTCSHHGGVATWLVP